MARYLPKRPKSGPLTPERLKQLQAEIFRDPRFRAIEQRMAMASKIRQEQARIDYESHKDVHQWRYHMTPWERTMDAINRMTKVRKDYNDRMAGRDTGEDEARKYAERLANIAERKKSEG